MREKELKSALFIANWFRLSVSSIPCSQNTLDEKGQPRDTSTHVTFNALNSTKNSPVAAG